MDGKVLTASRPPGYVWFLAIPEFFHAGNTALRIFNASSLAFCQLFLFLLASRMASKAVGALAVLLSLFYPVFLYTATVLFPQTMGAALLLMALWLLLDKKELKASKLFLAGIVWAFLVLAIPTFFILGAFLALWLLWRRKDFRRRLLLFAAPVVILLSGWSLRNDYAMHSVVFVATNGGINLLLGNSEHITATSGSSANVAKYTEVGHQLSEEGADKYYADSAKLWIRNHPKQFVVLYVDKLAHYFWYFDKTTAEDRSIALADPAWRRVLMFFTYEPLLLLFFLRLALFRKFPLSEAELCLIGLYLVNALLTAMFFPRIRFRLPLDWLLLVVVANLIGTLRGQFKHGGSSQGFMQEQLSHRETMLSA
jgi:4-amino-4-deoxy-L-arabinose transferase-like glycosyltransferase